MRRNITIINGPNLNFLGKREPEIYGYETLGDIEQNCKNHCKNYNKQTTKKEDAALELTVDFYQSNHEGGIVDFIQNAVDKSDAIIINPAAYTHTSIAILDALKIFKGIVVEVHLSNIHQREDFRQHSFVSKRANAIIAGCGIIGYQLAIDYVVKQMK